jgi:hypothetical protein
MWTVVDGSAIDGVLPIAVLEEVVSDEHCTLLKRNNPFCDPPCGSEETCDWDGSCIDYPDAVHLGTVTLAGLESDIVLEPVGASLTYFDTSLPHPAWVGGEPITMTATDGPELHGVAAPPLLLGTTTWTVEEGMPLELTWDVLPEPLGTELYIALTVDQHGLTPATVTCRFDDTGSAEVSAELVGAFLEGGVSGFPNGLAQRRSIDSAPLGEGCLEFVVSSLAVPDVGVEGVIPCHGDPDCPEGMHCDTSIELCVPDS